MSATAVWCTGLSSLLKSLLNCSGKTRLNVSQPDYFMRDLYKNKNCQGHEPVKGLRLFMTGKHMINNNIRMLCD